MTNTKINGFDRTNLRALRADFDAALASVAEKYGIKITTGNVSYRPEVGSMKIELATIREDGTAADDREVRARELFPLYAPMIGLEKDTLGKKFRFEGHVYTVAGYLAKSKRFPILVEREDGKKMKFTVSIVQNSLKAAAIMEPTLNGTEI